MVPNINNSLFHLAFAESNPSSIFFKLFIQKFWSFYIYTILGYVFMLPFLGKGITYASLLCKTMRSCLTLCHHFLQKAFVDVKMKVISCLHCLRFLDLRAQSLDDQSQLLIQEFTWERCDLNLLAVNVKVIQMGNIYNVTSNLNIRAIFRTGETEFWGRGWRRLRQFVFKRRRYLLSRPKENNVLKYCNLVFSFIT